MLAALSDYFVWWQIPLLVLFLAAWIFGGGALLWVGGRFIVKTPTATFWRSVATNVLAGFVAFCASAAVSVLGLAMAADAVMGLPSGLAAGLLLTWWLIKAMFRIPFGKAILAWLPTIASNVVATALLASILILGFARAREVRMRARCKAQLSGIGKAIEIYIIDFDEFPPDLETLIRGGQTEKFFRCPSARSGRRHDYFYLPPSPSAPRHTMIVCDLRDNHKGQVRHVLIRDGSARQFTEQQFQAELAKPHNAAFAVALREAEGPTN